MMRTFVNAIGVRLAAARRLGLARTAVKACRRTRVLDLPALRRWDTLNDERIRRPERMRVFLERYEAAAAALPGWRPLAFEGARVLEVGCGPLGGWGPLAVARGAAAYLGVDPAVDPALIASERFVRAYLGAVFEDLAAAGGVAPAAGMAALRARAHYVAGRIEALAATERFDLVLSNSCLEHIEPFAPFVRALAARLAAGARMLHLVDFSNHRSKASPFRPLYDLAPDAYRRRYGRHVNLLRAPDIEAACAAHGLRVRTVPVDVRADVLEGIAVDPWWRQRYPPDVLAVRTALLVTEPAAIPP